MKARLLTTLVALVMMQTSSLLACTTFVLENENQIVYGRNFDFDIGTGFVVNNQKGIEKYSLLSSEKNAMTWISKYGSITFNQLGKEFPYGGMNEMGLVIAQMYLSEAKYSEIDDRKAITQLQWIQYQLDMSATVEEVMASDSFLRISGEVPIGIHYLLCDANGNKATIEILNGKMVCHSGNQLPIPLLTNNTYDESISYLKQFDVLGGDKKVEWNTIYDIEWSHDQTQSINKVFATAANRMDKIDEIEDLVKSGFEILTSVTINDHTKWSTVFDISNRIIYFKNEKHEDIVALKMSDFNFKADHPSMILDIQSATPENVLSQFVDYTTAINTDYVFNAYKPLMEDGFIPFRLPDEALEAQARYPETLKKAY